MVDQNGKPRPHGSTLSLSKVIQSFGLSIPCTMHNAGNDAFMCLWVLQMLLDGADKVKAPTPRAPVTIANPFLIRPPFPRSNTMPTNRSNADVRSGSLLSVNTTNPWRRSTAPEFDELGTLQGTKASPASGQLGYTFEKMKLR
jgi:hypothetical protein